MMMFGNLGPEDFELVEGSATKYRVTEAGRRKLHPSFVDQNGFLNYFNFLEALLMELQRFLREGNLPDGMSAIADFEMCESCGRRGESDFAELKHCKKCFPGVTFTKAGPCLILKRTRVHNGQEVSMMVSIDLIPLLPCPEKNPIVMFNLVTAALFCALLPNWLPYTRKFVRTDCLLPEAQSSPNLPEDGYVAFKVLHVSSDEDTFILRPGQTLAMENLQNEKLKKTYCYLKALKTIMGVGYSSYQLKKVLLLEDFSRQAQTAEDAIQLLFVALNHPHLKPGFHGHVFKDSDGNNCKIDYEFWQDIMDENASNQEKNDVYYMIPLNEVK